MFGDRGHKMRKGNETVPCQFPQVNGYLYGESADPLPIHYNGHNTTSCWKIPFWKRFRVLFTGKVFLVVHGDLIPPLWVDTKAF